MNALGGYIAIAEYAVFDSGTGESSDAHYATVFAKFKSATESRSTPSEKIPLTINVRLEDGRIVPLLNPEDLLPTSQARNLRVSEPDTAGDQPACKTCGRDQRKEGKAET